MALKKTRRMSGFGRIREVALMAGLAVSGVAWAALPTVAPPSGVQSSSTDWLAVIKGYLKDGGAIIGLAVATIAFLWVGYMGLAKFNEARNGRAEWAEVGLYGVAGAGLLLFVTFLLTQASSIL